MLQRLMQTLLIASIHWIVGACNVALPADSEQRGFLVEVPFPITNQAAERTIASLRTLAGKATDDQFRRTVVLLQFGGEAGSDGQGTKLENALSLARALGSGEFRGLRIIAFVAGPVRGHAILPILACDQTVVTATAELGDASIEDDGFDETVAAIYLSIAARRGVYRPAVVRAMLDPSLSLTRITDIDGGVDFVDQTTLDELRDQGKVVQEEQLSAVGQTLRFSGTELRQSRIASHQVRSADEAAEVLEVNPLRPLDSLPQLEVYSGLLIEVTGTVSGTKVRRLESNLAAKEAQAAGEAWILAIDSPGGSLNDSLRLASRLSIAPKDGRVAAGWVANEALGDSVLFAAACRPLYVAADARLGGPGARTLDPRAVSQLAEAIDQIGSDARRPVAVLTGLLDPQLAVYRFTEARTGAVRYATEQQIAEEQEQAARQRERWQRGARLELEKGISGAQAVELGLADGLANDLEDVTRKLGLEQPPRRISDRPIIRFVEWLGSRPLLPFLLLVIAFSTFSMEMSSPGLGVPGFISLLSFGLFFWMNFLAGTAEWFEVTIFVLGVICILIELFVLPGVGVFGIGGIICLIGGVVLASQTFVIPTNPYQYARLSQSLWTIIISITSLIAGVIALKSLLPNRKLFAHLHLDAPDDEVVSQREQLVDFSSLLGQVGNTMTALRPAGKARFGEQILPVVSDGSIINADQEIRVVEVLGNRIVVESTDEPT